MNKEKCFIEGCSNHGRYCRRPGHTVQVITPLKTPNKIGDNLKEKLKVYSKESRKYITANPLCKLSMEGCESEAKCVHHTKGREGDLLLDKKFWMPSCYSCNIQVEIKDKEAREKGLKLSKFN